MKKFRLLANFLVFLFICTSVAAIPVSASFAPITESFDEWSSDLQTGEPIVPTGWTYVFSRDGQNSATLAEEDGDKFIRFNYTTADNKDYYFRKGGLGLTESIVIEEYFQTSNNGNTRNFLLPIWDSNWERSLTLTFRNGVIKANNGGTDVDIGYFGNNTWYHIRLVVYVDETTHKPTSYDVYINNALKAKGFALGNLSNIDTIAFLLSTAYTTGTICLNDISVKPLTETYTPFQTMEDFEGWTVGSEMAGTLTVPNGYGLGTAGVHDAAVVKESSGNHVFKITDKAGTSKAASLTLGNSSYPLNYTGSFVVETRIKLDGTGLSCYPFFLYDTAGTKAMTARFHSGKIYAFYAGGSEVVGTYTAGVWYNLKLKVLTDNDTSTADTFELYLNDKLLKSGQLESNLLKLRNITLAEIAYGNAQSVYLDDVMVYPVPEESENIFDEDFSYYGTNAFTDLGYNSDFWNIGGLVATTFNSLDVVKDDGTQNRVLRLTTQQGTTANTLFVQGKNFELTGKISIEEKIKLMRTDTRAILFRLYDTTDGYLTVWIQNNQIRAYDDNTGGFVTLVEGITQNEWMKLKVIANIDGIAGTPDTYDVYLNEDRIAANFKLSGGGLKSAIQKIEFCEYQSWGVKSVAYLDDISIRYAFDTSLTASIRVLDDYGVDLDQLYENENITICADVTNNTNQARNPVLIVAMYDMESKQMMDSVQFIYGEEALASGDEETLYFSFKLPSSVAETRLKVFVWDGFDTMIPVTIHSLEG